MLCMSDERLLLLGHPVAAVAGGWSVLLSFRCFAAAPTAAGVVGSNRESNRERTGNQTGNEPGRKPIIKPEMTRDALDK